METRDVLFQAMVSMKGAPILVTRDPIWAFGAEIIGNNFGVEKVENGRISDATRCLVLVYGGTLAKSKVHEFVKRAILNHPYFQSSNAL